MSDHIGTPEAARIVGCHPATLLRAAEERGYRPVNRAGRNGQMRVWLRADIEQLAAEYKPRQRQPFEIGGGGKSLPATTAEWQAIIERAEIRRQARLSAVRSLVQSGVPIREAVAETFRRGTAVLEAS